MTLAEPQALQTRTGKLSELARHVILPNGIVSTGWPAVRATCQRLGVFFDGWQDGAGRCILAKRIDGLYAADTVIMSIARQVGKTYLIGWIIFALCIIRPKTTVIWTAHRFKTAHETFMVLKGMALRKVMRAHVNPDNIYSGSNNLSIGFRNGSRILFGARERGFGRGFSGVDVLVFDEGQILSATAMEDMVPTTNAAPNPLIFLLGTPPRPEDPSEVFSELRRDALDGTAEDVLYIEFSADPDGDIRDWEQVAKANPSYPLRTNRRAILRMMKNLTEDSFRREGMGIWDDDIDQGRKIPLEVWDATGLMGPKPDGQPRFFITVAREMESAAITVAAASKGMPHVELADQRSGVGWLTERVHELRKQYPRAKFGAYAAGPVKSWVPTFEEFGVDLQLFNVPENVAGSAHLKRLAENRLFTHSPDQLVRESLEGAEWRDLDGGGWVLDWKNSHGDPSLIAGVIGALWLLEASTVVTPAIY